MHGAIENRIKLFYFKDLAVSKLFSPKTTERKTLEHQKCGILYIAILKNHLPEKQSALTKTRPDVTHYSQETQMSLTHPR